MNPVSEFEIRGEEHFTGHVLSKNLTGPSNDARLYQVTFNPAARTHWHSHSEGQTIIITSGIAWVGYKVDGNVLKKVLSKGESFHFTPGLEHWHGASPGGIMEHFAFTQGVTDWKYPVSEEEYYIDSDHDITKDLTILAFAFSEAEKNKDIEFLDNHLSEDLIFRRVNGKIANKKSFMDNLKTLRYEYNIPMNIEVFPATDKLSAAVSLLISAKIAIEPPIEGVWRNIRLFQKKDDRWQLTGWYNEAV